MDSNLGKPDSASVGTCGSVDMRFDVVTARALSLPERIKGMAGGAPMNIRSTWPLITSVKAAPPPL